MSTRGSSSSQSNLADVLAIRVAEPRDATALSRFAARVFEATYAHANTPENMRAYLAQHFGVEQQTAELRDPTLRTLLVERGAEIVGFAQLRRGGAPAVTARSPIEISRIYVDHTLHGLGVGAKLLKTCVAAAAEVGHDVLWLGVWESNGRAISFYQKMGFRIVGEQTFTLGEDVQRDHVMLLSVPGQGDQPRVDLPHDARPAI